ncbi:hypothetical protein M3Y98_00344000 [Aphelenchoides besseyi]|nr:hypothetical protein M3Y98_00344000 [Aphelenchoides besseyi]KAI6194389.1 hypothetical protein M3Y96_01119500 [Aphelenchoides besseyi]
MLIDCHCHLADELFAEDADKVVERAKQSGVEGIVVVAQFANDQQAILDLAEKYPKFCYPALGVHPVQREYSSVTEADFESIEKCIRTNGDRLCALGEIGLDFSPRYLKNGDEDKRIQREVFRRQIELANELQIPVNVHSRSAGKPAIKWLLEHNANSVLMHCYSGNVKSAKPAIEAGFYFSIPPCFANSPESEKLVRAVPLQQLCLETDSPFLSVNREERNEPMNVIDSAKFIARIKETSLEEVKRITTENAKRLFRFV